MTEPTLDHTAAADDSAPSSWQERKALLLVAGVGAVLVVGLGAWFLLAGDSGDDLDGLVAKPAPRSTAAGAVAGAAAGETPVAASTVPAKVENLGLARDPFKALYPPKVETPAQPAAPDTPPVQVPSVPNLPPVDPSVPQVPTAPEAATVKVTVVDIDFTRERVKVRVDGGEPIWMGLDDRTSSTPQVTLDDFRDERGGVATFFAGEDPGDAVDIKKGKSHTFS